MWRPYFQAALIQYNLLVKLTSCSQPGKPKGQVNPKGRQEPGIQQNSCVSCASRMNPSLMIFNNYERNCLLIGGLSGNDIL